MTVTVDYYLECHGDKTKPKDPQKAILTKKGRAQVKASSHMHLSELTVDLALNSGKTRAWETMEIAMRQTQTPTGVPVEVEDALYFEHDYQDLSRYPEATKTIAGLQGFTETVHLWLTLWPEGVVVRARLQNALVLRARLLVASGNKDHYVVVGGSHGPTAELAALDPVSTPRLREADIAHYTVEVSESGAEIVASEVLLAPEVNI